MKIGFSSSNKPLAKLIRYVTKSKWSHCFVVLGEINGVQIIGEAKAPHIRLMPITKIEDEIEIIELQDTENSELALLELLSLTGKNYGYFQLVGFLWSKLFKKVNPFTDNYVCSEYVALFLKSAGIFSEDIDENNITPQEIYERLKWKE
jgi:hypothetical protein